MQSEQQNKLLQNINPEDICDEEIVVRLCFDHDFIDEDGGIHTKNFAGLIEGYGCSVIRKCEELLKSIEYTCSIKEEKGKKCYGMLVTRAKKIKNAVDEFEETPFIIKKTSTNDNPAHADIFVKEDVKKQRTKTQLRILRRILAKDVFIVASQEFIDTNQLSSFIYPCETSS